MSTALIVSLIAVFIVLTTHRNATKSTDKDQAE